MIRIIIDKYSGLAAEYLSQPIAVETLGSIKLINTVIVCPLADSYVASAAREARSVAELAATIQLRKKTNILVVQQTTFFSQLRSRL